MKTPLPSKQPNDAFKCNTLTISHPSKKDYQKKRYQAWRSGYWAETLAAWYLRLQGYQILGQRVKTPHGEIDLIAKRHKVLVFIEVKFRPTLKDAAYSLGNSQKKRILKAAEFLMAKHFKFELVRFDVILVTPWAWPHHLKNVRLQLLK